jgi:hypothetical protein
MNETSNQYKKISTTTTKIWGRNFSFNFLEQTYSIISYFVFCIKYQARNLELIKSVMLCLT